MKCQKCDTQFVIEYGACPVCMWVDVAENAEVEAEKYRKMLKDILLWSSAHLGRFVGEVPSTMRKIAELHGIDFNPKKELRCDECDGEIMVYQLYMNTGSWRCKDCGWERHMLPPKECSE